MSQVAKVSRRGYSIQNAADYQLAYSSGWPLLKIAKMGSFTISNTSLDVDIVTHDLGYNPAYLVFIQRSGGGTALPRYLFFPQGISERSFFYINSSKLRWLGASVGSTPPAGPITVTYVIFAHDLEENYTAASEQTSPEASDPDDDFSFKMSKPGEIITSTDDRDFVLDSDMRSPMVHMSGTVDLTELAPSTFYGLVTHDLNYFPMHLLYKKHTTHGYQHFLPLFSVGEVVVMNTTQLEIDMLTDAIIAYIIFKDPVTTNE